MDRENGDQAEGGGVGGRAREIKSEIMCGRNCSYDNETFHYFSKGIYLTIKLLSRSCPRDLAQAICLRLPHPRQNIIME